MVRTFGCEPPKRLFHSPFLFIVENFQLHHFALWRKEHSLGSFSILFLRITSIFLFKCCFADDFDLSTYSWQYSPPAIHNQSKGVTRFVGLRNGGATCYMNSIIQQLFALVPIRNTVLSARPDLRLQQDTEAKKSSGKETTAAEVAATCSSVSGGAGNTTVGSDSAEVSSLVFCILLC